MGEGVKILEKGDVAPGSSTAVDVREQKVAVFNVAGTFSDRRYLHSRPGPYPRER